MSIQMIPNSRFQLEASSQKHGVSSQEVKPAKTEKESKEAGTASSAEGSVNTKEMITISTVNQADRETTTKKAAVLDNKEKTHLSGIRRTQFDQYIPEVEEEKQGFGHYAVVADEKGKAKIEFDSSSKTTDESAASFSGTEKKKTKAAENESSSGNEQNVLKLKNKKKELRQKIKEETDPGRIRELKRKLAQVEKDLKVRKKTIY